MTKNKDDNKSSYGSLNEREKIYIKTHLLQINGIKTTKDKAFSETKRIFYRNDVNDASDAFRHCYWAALMVKEVGYNDALTFTNIHESKPENDPAEKEMDLHNNRIGLEIGRMNLSDEETSHKCLLALHSHQLKVIKP